MSNSLWSHGLAAADQASLSFTISWSLLKNKTTGASDQEINLILGQKKNKAQRDLFSRSHLTWKLYSNSQYNIISQLIL